MTGRGSTSRIRLRALSTALALAIVLAAAVVATRTADAQTFSVLYAFAGGVDGQWPQAGVIRDTAGNLYGTTYGGGTAGDGTVFMLDQTGKETVLHSFAGTPGADGATPFAGLVRDTAGNLYGTTYNGGLLGAGIVFMVDQTGKETVLHHFTGASGGGGPFYGSLIRDKKGNLYGTTFYGGLGVCHNPNVPGCGTVFMLDTKSKETVLHNFNGADGGFPQAGLVKHGKSLFGATPIGGDGAVGTVFMVNKKTQAEAALYSFSGPFAHNMYGSLIRDKKGNLYGTTSQYGTAAMGSVFKVDTTGNGTVLYSFTGTAGDGRTPWGGLVQDSKGNLYGTTLRGGTFDFGTVYMLDPSGNETVLHSFAYSSDGALPQGDLVLDPAGNLYGTTSLGGPFDNGTVFKLTP